MKSLSNTPAMKINDDLFMTIGNNPVHKNTTLRGCYSDDFPADFFKHDDISYSFNEFGFRSDSFSKDNNEFLFAGCSHTFGVGLPKNIIWASRLNEILGGKKFLNIGMPGASIDLICYNVMRYIERFGKPKGVFILFPDFYRKLIIYDQKILTKFAAARDSGLTAEEIEENILKSFMHIKNLELFCNALDIPLVYSSWQRPIKDVMLKLKREGFLSNVFDIEDMSMIDSNLIDKTNSKFPHYWDVARDNEHFGEFENLCFAHRFKQAYEQN
jgi:hypothetical protein